MNTRIHYLIFLFIFFPVILFFSDSDVQAAEPGEPAEVGEVGEVGEVTEVTEPGEDSEPGEEKIMLITDKPYYFSGEKIYYKLFFHSDIKSDDIKEKQIAYTELWDEQNQLMERQIVRLSSGQAHGIFSIDPGLHQGNYLIRAYLKKYLDSQKSGSAAINLLILNLGREPLPILNKVNENRESRGIADSVVYPDQINLSTNRESYRARSEIKVNVKLPDQLAGKDNFFVAAARYSQYFPGSEFLGTLVLKHETAGNKDGFQDNSPSKIYLRGNHSWTGKSKKQLYELIVYTVLGEDPILGYEYTNKQGEFKFDISHISGNEHLYLSAVNGLSENVEITEKKYPEPNTVNKKDMTFQWKGKMLNRYMENYRVRQTIKENYNLEKLETITDTVRIYDTTRVYDMADKTYELSDYVDFEDMPELIRELLLYVKIKNKNDRYRLFIFNRSNPELKQDLTFPELERDPLFLVNGIPTKDHDFIVNMDVDNIDVIEILYSKEALFPFGWLGRSGILAIYTHRPVKVPNYIRKSVKGIFDREGKKYFNYGQENLDDPLPNFDPLPFWDPELKITDYQNEFSFYCGDEAGNLEISIIGLNHKGELIRGSKVVRIEPLLD